MKTRCAWCTSDPLYREYHDKEWGVPVHDDRALFEFLVLEGAQAGLSWITILKKRVAYRLAFDHFDYEKIAGYGEADLLRLLGTEGIIRNRLKINSAIKNAQVSIEMIEQYGSLDAFFWRYVDGKTIHNHWKNLSEMPAATQLSEKMSRDLKKLGFSFVGPTICYSFLQATGMINDHTIDCFRHSEIVAMDK